MPRRRARGVLLVELLVAVVVLAVLAALALPSFHLLVRLHRVRAVVVDLQADIAWARAEAVRRGMPVALGFASADTCAQRLSDARQRCRWIVATGNGDDASLQDPATLLRSGTTPAGTAVRYGVGSERLVFDAGGHPSQKGNSFTVLAIGATPQDPTTRTLCVSSGGRVRIEQGDAC